MTVVNPKSISGITSITTASGSDNLLTIHTSDANNTERLRIDSTGTTKIVTGIVTTLTATGSAKVGTGITLSPDGDVFTVGVSTFRGDFNISGSRLRVTGPSTITNNAQTIIAIDNADDNTAGLGGKIGFAAKVNETARTLAAVGGLKSIAGTGNFSGDLALYTRRNGVANLDERVRITSGGNVGIGVSNPAYKLHIKSESANALTVKSTVSGANILVVSDDTETKFQTVNGNFQIEADVQNNVAGSSIKFLIDNSEKARILSTGGITFNGDTATANALDDYEEGDWTPTFSNGSGSITVNAYSIQYGKYVKIGKMVYVEGGLRGNVTNNSNGTWDIGGLPFTVTNTPNASGILHGKEQTSWTVAPDHFSCIANTTAARARGGLTVGASAYTNGNTTNFNSGSNNNNRVYFAGWYRVEEARPFVSL